MSSIDYTPWTYAAYVVVSVALTVWVARTLFKNGRVFLVDAFSGRESLADSVNHLLVVGFYLINVGYVTLALKYGDKPTNLTTAIEFLSTKVGLVLVVLGAMHFFNLAVFSKIRHRGEHGWKHVPPEPDYPRPRTAAVSGPASPLSRPVSLTPREHRPAAEPNGGK